MKKNLLIIGDRIEELKVSSDSSLALAESCLKMGGRVLWGLPEQLEYRNGCVQVVRPWEFVKIDGAKEELDYFKTDSVFGLSEFVVLIRKDPPFDESYVSLCWMLQLVKEGCVFNPPEVLLTSHEKTLHLLAMSEGVVDEKEIVSMCVSQNRHRLIDYCESLEEVDEVVVKPWLGHGGTGVVKMKREKLLDYLVNRESEGGVLRETLIVQKYLSEVVEKGDRRVFVVGGEVVFDFVRMPKPGSFVANLSQGGSAVISPMTEEQKSIVGRIGKFLMKRKIYIAGLDFIGNSLSEINVTSPTGLRTFQKLTGEDVAKKVLMLIEGFY